MADFAAVKDYFVLRKQIPEGELPYNLNYVSLLAQHLMSSSWRPTNPEGNRQNREDFLAVLAAYIVAPGHEGVPYDALRAGFRRINVNPDDCCVDLPRGHTIIEKLPMIVASIRWRCPNETLDQFLDAFAHKCFIRAYDTKQH